MPPDDKRRDDGLIAIGRSAEEIDDRDLLLHRIPEPAVIRGVRVGPHEGIVDTLVARVDLAMSLALFVIPDSPALLGNTVRMDSSPAICRGLKIPRCGFTRGCRRFLFELSDPRLRDFEQSKETIDVTLDLRVIEVMCEPVAQRI